MVDIARVLIVDDDEKMRTILQKVLQRQGYDVTLAHNGQNAIHLLQKTGFDLVLSDIRMPGMDGLELLRQVREISTDTTVIMMTAFGSVDSAVEAMKQGAYDYINKPFKMDEVLICLSRAVEEKRLRYELISMREALEARYGFENIVGKSKPMQDMFDLIRRVAHTSATILIHGASGTGKELVAQAIHYNSPRKGNSFVPINCGAIPEDLLESELFGHVKGAFTGASGDKLGLFSEADEGTLFLDEISELSLAMQAKLLRVLQEKEVRRVGDTRSVSIDVRVIVASNKNLDVLVKTGLFREDLFYRLNVIPIVLPELRRRTEDIPLLVDHFLKKYADEAGSLKRISRDALAALMQYPWPGNVRELENAIERTAILCAQEEIGLEDLPRELYSSEGLSLSRAMQEGATLEELEKEYILRVLENEQGNQTKASEILGIDRRTLYRKLQRYEGDSDLDET